MSSCLLRAYSFITARYLIMSLLGGSGHPKRKYYTDERGFSTDSCKNSCRVQNVSVINISYVIFKYHDILE